MPYIYYKGKKYGDGTNQEIKAISIDRFIENNFDTTTEEGRRELDAFITAYNTDGFVIGADDSGYILIPGSDELRIENAIITDEEGSGLIIKEFPEEIDVLLNNGVQGYYTGMNNTAIVQGLRCVLGHKEQYYTGPQWSSGAWVYADQTGGYPISTTSDFFLLSTSQSKDNISITDVLKICDDANGVMDCPSFYTIKHLVDTGEIEKFLYKDFLLYVPYNGYQSRNWHQLIYFTLEFSGFNSTTGLYTYNVKRYDQANNVYSTGLSCGNPSFTLNSQSGFTVKEQPDLFGILLAVNEITFSEDKELNLIPAEYQFIPDSQSTPTIGTFSNGTDVFPTPTYSPPFVVFYKDPVSEKTDCYQVYDSSNNLYKKITDAGRNFIYTANSYVSLVPIPIALRKNSQDKYELIPTKGISSTQIYNKWVQIPQTFEENAYNRALTKRTEPVNWLDTKRDLGMT